MSWDPDQYLKFADHRLRPAIDLLNRVDLTNPTEIYDLGAGTGSVTRLIQMRWPAARIVGVDSSTEMLTKATDEAAGIVWEQADLATWQPRSGASLIYSNAALHWLPDHERLFPALLGYLEAGGVLAVQMPHNFTAPSHALVDQAARSGSWRSRLEPVLKPPPVAEASFYYDVIARHAAEVDIWETEYLHVLEGADPVKEWIKGSWLRPLLDVLDEPQRSDFEACYAALARDAYPQRADGRTLLPFRRLFLIARVA